MSSLRTFTTRGAIALAVVATLLFLWTPNASAGSSERITSFGVDIVVNDDGSAVFTETIQYDFGFNARHGIERSLLTRVQYDDVNDRRYPLTVISVAAVGVSNRYQVFSDPGGMQRIRIGDPNATVIGKHLFTIKYRLDGVVNAQAVDDELFWNVTGHEWQVPIDVVNVTVHVPGGVPKVACYAGAAGSNSVCDLALVDVGSGGAGTVGVFAQQSLNAYEGLTVVAAIPDTNGAQTEPQKILVDKSLSNPRSLSEGFALTPATGGLAGALAAIGAALVARVQFQVGRDRQAMGSATDVAFSETATGGTPVPLRDHTAIPVEFVPPDKMRPAQLGVLRDEVARTRHVSATLVDLAVRGFIRIEEVSDQPGAKVKDYRFVALPKSSDRTKWLPYEQYLFDQLFASGPVVELSALKNKFATASKATLRMMYEDSMRLGHFAARPDHVRAHWALGGVAVTALGVVVTLVLALNSTYALIGLPIVAVGLALLVGAKFMPRRTPKGTGADRRARGFIDFIENSEKHRAAFAERQNIFTEYLPYAVAIGATSKWANAFAALGYQPPDTSSWYVGSGPFIWTDFGNRVDNFSRTSGSTFVSTPGNSGSSGFSGGGFSGGGGGGGGGGSW